MRDLPDRENSRPAIRAMLCAQSLAVIGASNDVNKFGGMTMQTLIRGDYGGRLYPVNPRSSSIMGLRAYASVDEIPDVLDAVVVVVPADSVPGVLEEAARKGAQGAIIQSAGFREFGRYDLEEAILEVSQRTGIRLVGPNVQGVTYVPNKMCAVFFPPITRPGPLAVVTQSGSVTTAICEWAEREWIGVSAAVNLGNQVDLCESDFIDFFADDPATGLISLYLEGVRDGRRFLTSIQEAVPKKPVVLIKAGRSESGAKSAASHTGSLAGSHSVFQGACRQAGVVIVDELVHLYDAVKGFARLPVVDGNRVMVISTSGGAATLAADAIADAGLSLAALTPGAREDLRRLSLGPMARLENPLDLATLSADRFLESARVVDGHRLADLVLLNFADPVPGADRVVLELARSLKTPLVVNYMGGGEEESRAMETMQQAGVAVFATPEQAVRAVAAVWSRSSFLASRHREAEISRVA